MNLKFTYIYKYILYINKYIYIYDLSKIPLKYYEIND